MMTEALVLRLPNSGLPVTIECDACEIGIGAILMQEGRLIAYFNKGIKGRSLPFSTYEKELLVIVLSIRKGRHYLLGQHFIIKTNQHSLKHPFEQRIRTPLQQKWAAKLMGYDFKVKYKSGKTNCVDVLSCLHSHEEVPSAEVVSVQEFLVVEEEHTTPTVLGITSLKPYWIKQLRQLYSHDSHLPHLLNKYIKGTLDVTKYQMNEELLLYKKRIHLEIMIEFQQEVL